VPKGIISWWAGENGTQDFSGNNRGAVQGGVTFVPGKVALGFNFDGSTGYVNVPDSSSLHSIAKTVTVEMWATPKTIPAGSAVYLYSRRDPLTSESFSVYILADGTLGVLLRTSSSPTQTGSKFESVPGIVKFGKLQHVAATADTNTSIVRAYMNGSPVSLVNVFGPSSFSGTFSPVTHLYIGRREDVSVKGVSGAGYFPGLIDEASLYAVALTQSQIQSIVNAGINGKCR
jgi:hypothetical protein